MTGLGYTLHLGVTFDAPSLAPRGSATNQLALL